MRVAWLFHSKIMSNYEIYLFYFLIYYKLYFIVLLTLLKGGCKELHLSVTFKLLKHYSLRVRNKLNLNNILGLP